MNQNDKVLVVLSKISLDTTGMIQPPTHTGVWTRGDGYRYREFPYLKTKKHTDVVWDELLKQKPTKMLEVSGEMGSDGYKPAIILSGLLYIKETNCISFGSPNRLKNKVIWRSRNIKN